MLLLYICLSRRVASRSIFQGSRAVTSTGKTIIRHFSGTADCGETIAASSEPIDLSKYTNSELSSLFHNNRGSLTSAFITVLGTGGNELTPCFTLHTDRRIYLFNHPEGLYRMATSYKFSLSKQPITFFTRACWENIGGSVQLSFSQHDNRETQDYCGPPKVDEYINFVKHMTGKKSWKKEAGSVYKDENLTMSIIDLESSGETVAYSCKLVDVSGKFNVEKAIDLGVRQGPAFSLLASGRSVITEAGVLIEPSEVVDASKVGPTFLVIDCPSEKSLKAVTTSKHLQPECFSEGIKLIVHITLLDILQSEAYSDWMCSFGEDTQHLLLHSSVCPGEVGYRTSMAFSLPLHLMNKNVYHFPCLPKSNIISRDTLRASKCLKKDAIVIGRMFLKYGLKPAIKQESSDCLGSIEDYVKEKFYLLKKNPQIRNQIMHHRRLLSLDGSLPTLPTLFRNECHPPALSDERDALVTMLGTSASVSTKVRNVSSILIQTPCDGNFLLDCGEGTLMQLYRCFGPAVAQDIIQNLRAIFISHIHTDHHFGTFSVLKEFEALNRDQDTEALKIIGPEIYLKLLEVFHRDCDNVQYAGIDAFYGLHKPFRLSDITLKPVKVKHIKQSYGAVVSRGSDWSIVYSGDTAPCSDLVREGQNATLLIHEGTFASEDDFRLEKRDEHSTYSEALATAREMNAGFTLVTHFSSRFSRSPLVHGRLSKLSTPAVDLMSVRISDIHQQKLDSVTSRDIFRSLSYQWNDKCYN